MLDTRTRFEELWRPTRPFASNNLQNGVRRHSRESASSMRWVEANASQAKNAIVVDVDLEHAASHIKSKVWDDELAPEPNFITTNPASTHAQALYFIEGTIASGTKADRYMSSVTAKLTTALGGDSAYGGLIMRNPLQHLLEGIHDAPYKLKTLEEGVSIDAGSVVRYNAIQGEGRNVDLFNSLRVFAYRHASKVRYDSKLLTEALEERASELNLSQNMLNEKGLLNSSEVKSIVNSIVKFIERKFDAESFKKIQYLRAQKRWEKTAEARAGRLESLVFLREEMHFSYYDIAATLGGSPASHKQNYYRYKNKK